MTREEALANYLEAFVSENKKAKIAEVLEMRTRYITIVLEDIYQSQNASATLRTADCMGLQDAYFIENYNEYEVNTDVTKGATKWLDIHRFNEPEKDNTETCIQHLKAKGFRVVGTSLAADSLHPADLPLDKPLALLFGNEQFGLSGFAREQTDLNIKIPMYGFTQSFNISVSVAISLSHLIHKLHQSNIDWQLSQEEKLALTLQWYRRIADKRGVLEKAIFGEGVVHKYERRGGVAESNSFY